MRLRYYSFLLGFALSLGVLTRDFKMASPLRKVRRMADENIETLINRKAESFIENRKNSNYLIDLEEYLLSEDVNTNNASIEAVHKVFLHVIEHGDMFLEFPHNKDTEQNVVEKYKFWLREQYSEITSQLLEHMHHINKRIQKSSLCTLMAFVKAESEHPLKPTPDDKWYFPNKLFQAIIKSLISEKQDLRNLIRHFREFAKYDDIKIWTLKSVLKIFETAETMKTELFLQNVLTLLSQINFPVIETEDSTVASSNSFTCQKDNRPSFVLEHNNFRKVFSAVWLQFLKHEFPLSLHKKVLIILHQKVLSHLSNPLMLTDYLTDSYNIGGVISLLSLNGVFFLIQKYNLEYPDFYKKLYALFEPNVLNSQYWARFFYLSDLFLSSTHLPAYLVAAFVKRLARLTLKSSPELLLMIIPFIGNLIIRHPSLKVLLNRQVTVTEIANDPYIMEEPDPAKCNAMESSLWELKDLQSHYNPDVSTKARFIDQKLPQVEWDLSSLFELSSDELLSREKKDFKEAAASYNRTLRVYSRKEVEMDEIWCL